MTKQNGGYNSEETEIKNDRHLKSSIKQWRIHNRNHFESKEYQWVIQAGKEVPPEIDSLSASVIEVFSCWTGRCRLEDIARGTGRLSES